MPEIQSFAQWQQSPIQGAIPRTSPFTPADEAYLLETLTECRVKLSEALKVAQGYSRLPDLVAGLGDALQGIHDAAAIVVDPETYLD
jgi:hypothetical protein